MNVYYKEQLQDFSHELNVIVFQRNGFYGIEENGIFRISNTNIKKIIERIECFIKYFFEEEGNEAPIFNPVITGNAEIDIKNLISYYNCFVYDNDMDGYDASISLEIITVE